MSKKSKGTSRRDTLLRLDDIPVALVVLDVELSIIEMNRLARELFQFSEEKQVISSSFLDLIDNTYHASLKHLLDGLDQISTISEQSVLLDDSDASSAVLKICRKANVDGEDQYHVVIDITENGEVNSIESRYRMLVETMNDGLVIDNLNGILIYTNKAFCEMIGYDQDEIIGNRWTDFTLDMTEEEVSRKHQDRVQGISEHYELKWLSKNDDIVHSVVSAMPIFDAESKFQGTFAVVTDITQQKNAEETVQFYLDLLSHDIANQLQIIITSAGLLDSELPASYIDDARTDVLDAAQRCNRLITKVKRASKITALPNSEIDLIEVIDDKTTVLKRVYDATVHLEIPDSPLMVEADTLLGELIWNILENAARHNPKENKQIWISCDSTEDMVHLSISDDGPGISDPRKETIFDKSRRYGGVGLTLVDSMIRKYGGTISVYDRVEDEPNRGAKFVISLKLAE